MPNNTDRIERATMARLNGIYADALKQALKEQAAFLKKIKDVDDGKIKPPQYYVDRGEVNKWREGFTRELIRQQQVIEGIIKRLDAAGIEAGDVILKSMQKIWRVNREETAKLLQGEAKKAGINVNFAQYDAHQLDVLMQKNQSPFSKIAYKNLGKNPAVRRRLQNELAQATILGESQQEIIKRIQKVTRQAQWQARRVAQTERTRVQSQATYMTEQEAVAKGVNVVNRWSTRMVNSRETHIALDGKWAKHGERFPGSILRFPGDPEAPAGEVINCHCALVPKVLKPGQEIDEKWNVKIEKELKNQRENAKIKSEKLAGVKRGEPMTREQANQRRANPHFDESRGYQTNCQTCVVAYEARLRGYDVSAKANTPGSMLERLSRKTNLAWIDPQTGENPEYITGDSVFTAKGCVKWFNDTIKQGERYTVEFAWRGGYGAGHIISIDRNERGEIRLYDPQTGNTETQEEKILEYVGRWQFYSGGVPLTRILRIDNMDFNKTVVNKILEAAQNENT